MEEIAKVADELRISAAAAQGYFLKLLSIYRVVQSIYINRIIALYPIIRLLPIAIAMYTHNIYEKNEDQTAPRSNLDYPSQGK